MLSERQKRFCEEYVIDLNATAAYKRAGYSVRTDSSAASSAATLLRNPKIQTYIQELMNARSLRTQITSDDVFLEIAKLAFSDITNVATFDDSGVYVKNSSVLPEHVKASVLEVINEKSEEFAARTGEISRRTSKIRVKMHDKLGALKELAKHFGMNSDFNCAIATLRNKYGLTLRKNNSERWIVDDASISPSEEAEEID